MAAEGAERPRCRTLSLLCSTATPHRCCLAGRLMAYLGPTVTVADVVVRPSRSIIKQSYDARERRNDSSLPFHLGCVHGAGARWWRPRKSRAMLCSTSVFQLLAATLLPKHCVLFKQPAPMVGLPSTVAPACSAAGMAT